MWRILVLLTGSLGLYIVITVVVIMFLCAAPWQVWAAIAVILGFYFLRELNNIRKDNKYRKELRKRLVIEAEQKRQREMNPIHVVAAVIHDNRDRIFVTQRGYGDMKGKWEFPGGKIEPGETQEEALKREIREELDAEITIERYLEKVVWDYPEFRLIMYCYLCRLESGYTLKEHSAARWLKRSERMSVDWLLADRVLFLKATF